MIPQQTLRYVQVPGAVWSPEMQRQYVDCVTAKGKDADGTLNQEGVLQISLLITEPFQSLADRDATRA